MARLRSISSRSSSRLSVASFSRLMRPSSRNRHASNSAAGSSPSVSSRSGTTSAVSSVGRMAFNACERPDCAYDYWLSASSRLMLSATSWWLSCLRFSASASLFAIASSVYCESASRSKTVSRPRLPKNNRWCVRLPQETNAWNVLWYKYRFKYEFRF